MSLKNRFNSFAARLTLAYALVLLLTIGAIFSFYYYLISNNIFKSLDAVMELEMNEVARAYSEGGLSAARVAAAKEAADAGARNALYRIVDDYGKVVVQSDTGSWPANIDEVLRNSSIHTVDHDVQSATISHPDRGAPFRFLQKRMGDKLWIQCAMTLANEDSQLRLLRYFLVGAGIFSIAIAALLGGWFVRRALVQVNEVTRIALEMSPGDAVARVPLRGSNDEIDRLAGAFNTMLERINLLVQQMREVIDNVAHELRSPITSLRGNCELILTRTGQSSETTRFAEDVLVEADRLLRMINDMLEISEMESRTGPLHMEDFDLSAELRDVLELFQPLADQSGVGLSLEAPQETRMIGDRQKLQRVFFNLIDNSLKYSGAGRALDVSLSKTALGVRLVFTDNGPGIDGRDLPKIFDRFFRGTGTRSGPGSGLGLSLARAIVRAHSGTITATSEVGKGARFEIELPLPASEP
jgi:signal transduction histidine kinase